MSNRLQKLTTVTERGTVVFLRCTLGRTSAQTAPLHQTVKALHPFKAAPQVAQPAELVPQGGQEPNMPLPLELSLLGCDKLFQRLCFRLAQKQFPQAIPVAHAAWDGGRDILSFGVEEGDVVWQCKYTQQSLSKLKPKVRESLDALDPRQQVHKWILCLSVDVSGPFLDWLRTTLPDYPFIANWEVWDREIILLRLEEHPDVLEVFFYPIWKSLETRFRTDELELVRFQPEPACGWRAPNPAALELHQIGSQSDLVFDIVVRSRGTLQSLVHGLRVTLYDVRYQMRGLPGTALLYSQHTYTTSLRRGRAGTWVEPFDPPLTVDAGTNQRFKIKLTDGGYAWTGYAQLTVLYGGNGELNLPTIHLRA